MAVVYFTGFETGDTGEIVSLGGGASIQSTTVRTGAYALQTTTISGQTTVLTNSLSLGTWGTRLATSLSSGSQNFLKELTGTSTVRLLIGTTTVGGHGVVNISDNGNSLGITQQHGTANVSSGGFHVISVAFDPAAGGQINVWVDGVLDITTTHSKDVSGTPTTGFACGNTSTTCYIDDVLITNSNTNPGTGQCIARQGTIGTPTYDAWAKNGAATAALCWSDTPFSSAKNCSSSTALASQTMLVAPFSATQSGHGSQVVGSGNVINAAKTLIVGKSAVLSDAANIVRIVNGVETDTAISYTTSDAFYSDGFWTTTAANLDLLEAGVQHSNNTNLNQVEDVWVMVDFQPATAGLSGAFATADPGTFSIALSQSPTLTGASAEADAGSFSVAFDTNITLPGASSLAIAGAFTVSAGSGVNLTLTGASAEADAGSFTVEVDVTKALTGAFATGAAGTFEIDKGANLTGAFSTGAAGTLGVLLTQAFPLIGASAEADAGAFTPAIISNITFAMVGAAANAQPGMFTVGIPPAPNTGIIISVTVQGAAIGEVFGTNPRIDTSGAFAHGADIVFEVGLDLSQAVNIQLTFTRPNGTQFSVGPSPFLYATSINLTTPQGFFFSKTALVYRVAPSVLVSGVWQVQASYQAFPGAAEFVTMIGTFEIG